MLAGADIWGRVSWRFRGVVVPEGMGEALEDFDAVGKLKVFCVGGVWGGATCVDVFEEEGEVAQAPEEAIGAVGEL